jgi:hypothetical protein
MVLPLPDSPTRATMRPASIANETSSTTRRVAASAWRRRRRGLDREVGVAHRFFIRGSNWSRNASPKRLIAEERTRDA